ncbi:putative uncharacterized alpha/beta hydrolase domain (DUF2235) [Lyophyllum shimeji]|uniref:Uncharacterized alpha/beta hydrolase domain (DUF2235) n=1 Tax=Lyophyllum shimeji TaxID=47721 RepID=A0A9P3PP09_LYOSH|nr:putative uncharacterized alpha/beta hydrolase domain (DUF2235) [Lyophyllum shimeji]
MAAHHAQEATAFSMTETMVERGDGPLRPTLPSLFSGTTLTTSPDPIPGFDTRHPERKEQTLDPRLTPATIPPEHAHRTLVLCFDGTGDQFDGDNSNIVQLVSLLKKNDRSKQMVYYQAGIGTYTFPKVATPFTSKVYKTLDEMVAWNLDHHVMSGYEFLMQNYVDGDRICLFGFSRGAYTARSLAGMLHKVGLLPADNHQQVPFAYTMYTRTDDLGWEQSNAFKAAFSVDVNIEFVGVWDTVDSVGLLPKRLPFTTSNTIVRTFRHAVSLDERRAKFKANLWNRPSADEQQLGIQYLPVVSASPEPLKEKKSKRKSTSSVTSKTSKKESEEDRKLSHFEEVYSSKQQRTTDVEEVWFAGCHCDVGGGSVSNKTRHSLARITLRWMVRECFKTNTGIMFDSQALRGIGLDPTTLYPYVTPRPPPLPVGSEAYQELLKTSTVRRLAALVKKAKPDSAATAPVSANDNDGDVDEELEDLRDALSPIYDQLKIKRSWWLLEIIPMKLRYQNGRNEWITYFSANLAKPRFIPKQRTSGVKVHRTVKLRMEANPPKESKKQKKYKPKAHLSVEPTWID